MSHTHAAVLVHCVFSTKDRAHIIPDCEALWRYLAVLAEDNVWVPHTFHLLECVGTSRYFEVRKICCSILKTHLFQTKG